MLSMREFEERHEETLCCMAADIVVALSEAGCPNVPSIDSVFLGILPFVYSHSSACFKGFGRN